MQLEQLRGRPVVLVFWSSWSGIYRAQIPVLEHAWQWYRDRDVMVIGVAVHDQEYNAQASVRRYAVTYPNGYDAGDDIAQRYHVRDVPELVLIDTEGRIRRRHVGQIEPALLRDYIEERLA